MVPFLIVLSSFCEDNKRAPAKERYLLGLPKQMQRKYVERLCSLIASSLPRRAGTDGLTHSSPCAQKGLATSGFRPLPSQACQTESGTPPNQRARYWISLRSCVGGSYITLGWSRKDMQRHLFRISLCAWRGHEESREECELMIGSCGKYHTIPSLWNRVRVTMESGHVATLAHDKKITKVSKPPPLPAP